MILHPAKSLGIDDLVAMFFETPSFTVQCVSGPYLSGDIYADTVRWPQPWLENRI